MGKYVIFTYLHIFLESIYKNPKHVNVILDCNSKNIGNFEPKNPKYLYSHILFSGILVCHVIKN